MSDLGSSTLKGFQPLGGLSEIWALSKLPPTSRMLRRLGAIGRELAIRLKAVEGSKFGFVGGKSTVTDFLVDVAMRYQSKGLLVAVEKDFIIEVSIEGIFSEEKTGYLHAQFDQLSGVLKERSGNTLSPTLRS